MMRLNHSRVLPLAVLLGACGGQEAAEARPEAPRGGVSVAARPACDPGNGGIELPDGFCAAVVADGVVRGRARLRHLAVEPDGDIYVGVQGRAGPENPSERGGILALRDTTGDGRTDVTVLFGPEGGTGVEIRDGNLYFATNSAVLRYRLGERLEPVTGPDTLVQGLPSDYGHAAKSIALGDGALFVNIGAPTNVCQPLGRDRERGLAGEDPCSQLETRAGVWRFDAERTGQRQEDGVRWATGIRNAVALAWNPTDRTPYAVQHGRDQLNLWPGFSEEDNAFGAAEELQRLTRGADFGWPYCFYDTRLERRVLAPEYGGDGEEVGRCAGKQDPALALPAHWAPNDLIFYTGSQFPERYRGGGFIAFHGSWNRAPLPQAGYRMVFVPFRDGRPAQEYETFAAGFAGAETLSSPGDARHRPMGLAEGPDGSLYITDSVAGRIWRVMYTGP